MKIIDTKFKGLKIIKQKKFNSSNNTEIQKIDLKEESFFSDLGYLDFNVDIEKL